MKALIIAQNISKIVLSHLNKCEVVRIFGTSLGVSCNQIFSKWFENFAKLMIHFDAKYSLNTAYCNGSSNNGYQK